MKRVLRGGSWLSGDAAWGCSVARFRIVAGEWHVNLGLRWRR